MNSFCCLTKSDKAAFAASTASAARATCAIVVLLMMLLPSTVSGQRRPAPRFPSLSAPAPMERPPRETLPPDTFGDGRAETYAALPPTAALLLSPQEGSGRYTRRGLVIGALVGGAGGLVYGTLIGLFCEGERDSCWGAVPIIGLLGAAGGGALGAIIGSAIPRPAQDDAGEPEAQPEVATPEPDTLVAAEPTPPLPAPERAAEDRTGSIGGSFGWANATIESGLGEEFSGSGSVVRFAGYAELRRWLAIGLEIGHASFGEGGAVRHASIAFRGTVARGTLSPFVSANFGAYQSTLPSLEYFGAGLGAGVRLTPFSRDRFFVDVEGRWTRNAHNIEPTRMTSLTAGGGIYW